MTFDPHARQAIVLEHIAEHRARLGIVRENQSRINEIERILSGVYGLKWVGTKFEGGIDGE